MTITSSLLPPTSVLPPVRKLPECTTKDISQLLVYLLSLCNPPVRGSRRRKVTLATSAKLASTQDLVLDAFERAHAIRWLTGLLSYGDLWGSDQLLQDAAALLALCAGTSAAGVIHRTFTFPCLEPNGKEIEVRIRDIPLDNHNFESVGAQTWGGACVLAEMIAEEPDTFLRTTPSPEAKRLRLLELGAGTGLVALAIGKVCNAKRLLADILATDFYPSVLQNLQNNIDSNFASHEADDIRITSSFLDWQDPPAPSELEPFDVVFGADIIYDHRHAAWIQDCLRTLLRKDPSALFHLVIPLRQTFTAESGTIDSVFGEGSDLVVKSKEVIICDSEVSTESPSDWEGEDVVKYAYYRIGWASV